MGNFGRNGDLRILFFVGFKFLNKEKGKNDKSENTQPLGFAFGNFT